MKTFFVSVSLFIVLSLSLNAKVVKFPEKDPVFSFTLPEEWTTKPANGGLECYAADGSNFRFLLRPFEAKTDAEARKGLSALIPSVKNSDMKDFKVGEIEEMVLGEMKMFVLKATMMVSDKPAILTGIVFSPKRGAYFGTMTMAKEDVDTAHRKVREEILSSITPISGEN